MKKYLKYISFFLLLAGVAFLYGFSVNRNQQRNEQNKLKEVDVQFVNGDNLFVTYQTVNKMLIQNFNDLKSQQKETILLESLENSLKSNEMVEDADVFLTVDGKLSATLKQRTPIARVNDEGVVYYIDSHGSKMPLSANYSARVPIVSGVKGTDLTPVFKLAKRIYSDQFLRKLIIGIEQTPTKEFVLKTRLNNHRIELGRLNSMDAKFEKLKAFYQKQLKDNVLEKYQTINLVYDNQVVCTKK